MRRLLLLLVLLITGAIPALAQTPPGLVDLQRPVVLRHPLAQGLLGWWRVVPGYTGGQTWRPLVGTDVGTMNSMTTAFTTGFQPTNVPYAPGEVRFPGSPSSVSVPGTFVAGLTAFTVVVGYRSTTSTKAYLYYERNSSANSGVVALALLESVAGDVALGVIDDAAIGSTSMIEVAGLGSTDGGVHYLGLVQTSKSAREGFFDGRSIGTNTTTIGTSTPQARSLGVRPVSASSYFIGGLLEVFTYNRALSATDMQQLVLSAQQGHPTLLRRGVPLSQMLTLFPQPPATRKGFFPWFSTP
jgi:hypothetical protein